MSCTVEIIYKPYYKKTLPVFTKTLPKSYEKYTEITKTASKIVLSTMIGLLDERLITVNAKRLVLTKQAIKMIHSNTLFEKTGEFELYLT